MLLGRIYHVKHASNLLALHTQYSMYFMPVLCLIVYLEVPGWRRAMAKDKGMSTFLNVVRGTHEPVKLLEVYVTFLCS